MDNPQLDFIQRGRPHSANFVVATDCSYIYFMQFEWDEHKRQTNFVKHGIDFEVAPVVFAGIAVTILDERQDYGERRSITLGALQGRVVVVAHTQRGSVTRIISMRKANEREQKIYRAHTEAAGRDDG